MDFESRTTSVAELLRSMALDLVVLGSEPVATCAN